MANPLLLGMNDVPGDSISPEPTGEGSAMAPPPGPPRITTYSSSVTITAEDNCSIYYTTDGRDPTPASTEYTGSLELGVGKLMVKAVAIRSGVSSSISTCYYSYTPRSMAISPESGDYEVQVHIKISSDHEEVRYTLDGSVPTKDSPLYSGTISIIDEGTTTITAAMFVDGALIGDVARRRYTITEAKLLKPAVLPVSGTYEAPLRITISGMGSLRFTLNGDEPTVDSPEYTNPIVVPSPCVDMVLKVMAYHETNPKLSSAVTEAHYEVIQSHTVEDGRQEYALPVQNLEFAKSNEEPARSKAEEVMAWLMASVEFKESKSAVVEKLRNSTAEAKREYAANQSKLQDFQREIGVANARRTQLEAQKTNFVSTAQQDVDNQLQKSRSKLEELKQKKKALNIQLEEARALHDKTVQDRAFNNQNKDALKQELQERYLNNKRELYEVDPYLSTDLDASRMIVAEQRHEIALLKATQEAIKQPATEKNPDFVEFAPTKRLVEIETVETIVPIPVGMMRAVTTVGGGGLQRLREKYSVDACIVNMGSNLAVKVVGHSMGVHRFVQELEGILGSSGSAVH